MGRAAVAELVGTFILVFTGIAVAVAALLDRPTAGGAYDSLAIALAFGLALAAVVAAIGHVSGFVVISVATDPRVDEGVAPIAVGFAVACAVFIGGPISGGAANPARALGPEIVSGSFTGAWIYIVGPLIGAVAAAFLYDGFIAQAGPPGDE